MNSISAKILFLVSLFMLCSCQEVDGPDIEAEGDGYVDVLPDDPSKGVILHAFNWKYSDITANLEGIKNAGYSVVQTSPVQQPKSGGARWEFFYQPVSFSIGDNSPLGTKAELQNLCETAEEMGVSIIVDIVFNHLATNGQKDIYGLAAVDPEVETYEPYIYQHQNECFHHYRASELSGSGSVTQIYPGLPDLNTANAHVQERALSLLKECIDVGVDGFRFDAAKHIETSSDASYPSSFWDNTLEEAKTYYHQKTNKTLFAYGEILNDTDGGRKIDLYTKYMKVTDNTYVNSGIYNAVVTKSHKAENIVKARYGKSTADKLVTWVESHDTFATEEVHMDTNRVARMWAVVANRKDTNSLFFARPDNGMSVAQVATYDYEDEKVGIINRFHNRFIDAEEYQSAVDTNFYVNERYTEDDGGAIIIDLALKGSHEITFKKLKNGYYFDQFTGKQVRIKRGKATIEFDSNGVCVLTKSKNKLRASLTVSKNSCKYSAPFTLTLNTKNATEAYYSINGGEHVDFVGTANINIGENVSSGDITTVNVYYSNGEISSEKTFTYEKVHLVEGHFNVINFNASYLDDYSLYIWTWDNSVSTYTKDFSYDNTYHTLLVDNVSDNVGFLLVIFEKDYMVRDIHKWEDPIKQTSNIYPSTMEFFDASTF